MGRLREERGQATHEYVALLAVVAIAIAALTGISASGVGASVLRGLQQGICAVAPGPCPRLVAVRDDMAPCEIRRDDRVERLGETIGIVELGTSQTLKAVRFSDGTVVVTLADGSDVGAVWKVGASGAAGGAEAGAKGRLGAGVTWGSGRSWTLPDEAAALDFIARYGDKATTKGRLVDQLRSRCSLLCDAIGWWPHEQLPPPDATYDQGGLTARADGLLLGGRADAELKGLLGRKVARDGSTTTYVQIEGELLGKLGLPVVAIDGSAGGEGVLSIARAPDGSPRSLGISVAGSAARRVGLNATASGRGAAARRADAGGDLLLGGLVEVEATLDLTDPAIRELADAVVDGLAHRAVWSDLPRRAYALGERIVSSGQIDVRAYRKSASSRQIGAEVALGVSLGAGWKQSTVGLELEAAWTRLPGLPYLRRDDCRRA